MTKSKIILIGIALIALLVGGSLWQKSVTPAKNAAYQKTVTSLMPYSPEWKLQNGEDALLVIIYLPGTGVENDQLKLFTDLAKSYQGKVKFASLDLTYQHPSYSNAPYATVYGVKESPTYILLRKGESAYHRHSGVMTVGELFVFIDFGLTNAPPNP